jgi:hypothetical protein
MMEALQSILSIICLFFYIDVEVSCAPNLSSRKPVYQIISTVVLEITHSAKEFSIDQQTFSLSINERESHPHSLNEALIDMLESLIWQSLFIRY